MRDWCAAGDDAVRGGVWQAGPVTSVHMPKDKVTGRHQGYGFVEFRSEEDADYAIKVMNMVKLFGKPIRANKSSQNKQSLDVGAWRCAAPLRCSCWCGASL